ncbi:MAG: A24 family peptidase [Candidatus Rifleibacteriota bacterium]
MLEPAQQILLLKTLAACAAFVAMITDSTRGKIYNWLTFPCIFLGWGLNFAFFGFSGLGYSLIATFVGIALYILPAIFGLIGMGDVKLMAGIGALGGTNFVVTIFLYTSALGLPHAFLIQSLNYGRNAVGMLVTSFTTRAFLEKTIHKENADEAKRYRFLLGIDIFLATALAIYHTFEFSF